MNSVTHNSETTRSSLSHNISVIDFCKEAATIRFASDSEVPDFTCDHLARMAVQRHRVGAPPPIQLQEIPW